MTMPPLLRCPPEIMMMISEQLSESMASRCSLAASCRQVFGQTMGGIYRHNIRHQEGSAMLWAAVNGNIPTMERAIRAKGNISGRYRDANNSILKVECPGENRRGYGHVGGCPTCPRCSPQSYPLLHWALAFGREDMAVYLIMQGADIYEDAGTQFGWYLGLKLWCWPRGGIRGLIDIDGVHRRGFREGRDSGHWKWSCTPLLLAISQEFLSTARLLISQGALRSQSSGSFGVHEALRMAALLCQDSLLPEIVAGISDLSSVLKSRIQREPIINVWPSQRVRFHDPLTWNAVYFPFASAFDRYFPWPSGSDRDLAPSIRALGTMGADFFEEQRYGFWKIPLIESICLLRWDLVQYLLDWVAQNKPSNIRNHLSGAFEPLFNEMAAHLHPENGISNPEKSSQDALAVARRMAKVWLGIGAEGKAESGEDIEARPADAKELHWDLRSSSLAWKFPRIRKNEIYQRGELGLLQYAADYCRISSYALDMMKLFLDLGFDADDTLDEPPFQLITSYMTPLQHLVDAFDINHHFDFGVDYEDELHAYLDTCAQTVRLHSKERRLLAAIDLLLSRGATPTRPWYSDGTKGENINKLTIIEKALGRFDPARHVYKTHKDARVGIYTLKLARLFLKHAEKSNLSNQMIKHIEQWILAAMRTLQQQHPVTVLTVRGLEWTGPARFDTIGLPFWDVANVAGDSPCVEMARYPRPRPALRRPISSVPSEYLCYRTSGKKPPPMGRFRINCNARYVTAANPPILMLPGASPVSPAEDT